MTTEEEIRLIDEQLAMTTDQRDLILGSSGATGGVGLTGQQASSDSWINYPTTTTMNPNYTQYVTTLVGYYTNKSLNPPSEQVTPAYNFFKSLKLTK